MELKVRTNGGNLTREDRALQVKLIELGLFDRQHSLYLHIEEELQKLSDANAPSKMFDLFLHYCSKRRKGKFAQNLYATSEGTARQKTQLLTRIQSLTEDVKIPMLAVYSSPIFFFYATAFLEEYIMLSTPHRPSNMYSFEVTASVFLSTILPYYSKEKIEAIYLSLLQKHRDADPEFNIIFKQSVDKESLIKMHRLFISQVKKIEIDEVINMIDSPLYLTPKEREPLMAMLQKERYRPLEYKFVEKAMNYKPNVNLMVNLDKPADYIKEMIVAIKPEWEKYNDHLSIINNSEESKILFKLRNKMMSTNKQKTLAGKLTDILYVYDQKVFGFTNTRIQDELAKYWKHFHPKLWKKGTSTSSTSTIYNYYSYGRKMIDEEYFKKY